jgi:DNA polymerase-3 subunit delta'
MKSFREILGQDDALRQLRVALREGRLAHGYLFFGPDGVGKRTTALAFARSILCRSRTEDGDACGRCPACARLRSGGHRGFHLVEPESTHDVRIEQIHELGRLLALTPVEGREQVAVFPDADRIGDLQANALLKVLEEPPPGAVLLFVTRRIDLLPETVRSRCQGIRFRPLSPEAILQILPEGEDVARLAPLSGGSLGKVERLREMGVLELLAEVDALAREDPVLAAEACIRAMRGGPGEILAARRERTAAFLSVLLERERQLVGRGGDARRADFCYRRLVAGLDNLRWNVDPDTVLRATLVEIGPRWTMTQAT